MIRDTSSWGGILGLFFCLFWPSLAHAGTQRPVFLEITPPLIQLGKITDTKPVSCFFTLKNITEKPITISRVKTFCGCTAAFSKEKTLQPGQKTVLEVVFDPKGRSGHLRWEVHLFVDLEQEPIPVVFETTVLKDDMVSEREIFFDLVRQGTKKEKKVWISPAGYPEFQIKQAIVDVPGKNEHFRVFFERGVYAGFYPVPRKAYCVTLSMGADMPDGRIFGRLKILTDIPGRSLIEFPISGKVCGEVVSTPDYVALGIIPPGKPITRRVNVYQIGRAHV